MKITFSIWSFILYKKKRKIRRIMRVNRKRKRK